MDMERLKLIAIAACFVLTPGKVQLRLKLLISIRKLTFPHCNNNVHFGSKLAYI